MILKGKYLGESQNNLVNMVKYVLVASVAHNRAKSKKIKKQKNAKGH